MSEFFNEYGNLVHLPSKQADCEIANLVERHLEEVMSKATPQDLKLMILEFSNTIKTVGSEFVLKAQNQMYKNKNS